MTCICCGSEVFPQGCSNDCCPLHTYREHTQRIVLETALDLLESWRRNSEIELPPEEWTQVGELIGEIYGALE